MQLLLVSNSTLYGSGYLDHAETEIRDFLGTDVKQVLFVPFALQDHATYAASAQQRFAKMGYELTSIHTAPNPKQVVKYAEAIFVGGGNTFRLLKALYDLNLIEPIGRRVAEGMPYIGSSAGSNIAAPTIKTTNDMPIVEPPSFDALNLIWFQINPHYLDADRNSTHMGETREQRLLQFHEENSTPVAAIREGAILRIENGVTMLKGSSGARIFRQGLEPVEAVPGDQLDGFLQPSPPTA
jgi:dipeptidase E